MSTAFSINSPVCPRALLICDSDVSPSDRNVRELLDFFSIPWTVLALQTIKDGAHLPWNYPTSRFCILGSASSIAAILQNSRSGLPTLIEKADSVYVYGFEETNACNELLRFLTDDRQAGIHPLDRTATHISVTSDFPEMCGPMSGMRIPVVPSEGDFFFSLPGSSGGNQTAIATVADDQNIFVRLMHRGVSFYLTACADVIDIHERVLKYFDIKANFCRVVPIIMFLKWAFADACWAASETSACLIVDDPLLRTRYGFLHLGRTLELMDEHNFAITIAFIPWNWRRTDPRAVQLFQARPDRLSLSIHGCDHTGGEFAIRSTTALNSKTRMANQRMEALFQRTSLKYDRIMIFPHGEFSPEAAQVLKVNGFVAAVNTEVAPSRNAINETELADVWDVAIYRYGTFPIFTRRYPRHGIENFAFDGLLGKPCLIAAHHDDFKDSAREILGFVDRLNSLKWNLRWRTLGDAISHCTRIRHRSDATSVVQLYANRCVVNNPSTKARKVFFIKKEQNADSITEVTTNGEAASWTCDRYLRFEQMILPGRTVEVRIVYAETVGDDLYPSGVAYGMNTRFRRYFSEVRDNYLSQNAFLNSCATPLRKLLKRFVPAMFS